MLAQSNEIHHTLITFHHHPLSYWPAKRPYQVCTAAWCQGHTSGTSACRRPVPRSCAAATLRPQSWYLGSSQPVWYNKEALAMYYQSHDVPNTIYRGERKQDDSVYLCIQQRVGFQEVVKGKLSCTQLGWEVLMGGEGPAWGGRQMISSKCSQCELSTWSGTTENVL